MKDPYLKPVILGGLFITFLSVIFAPGIFLWATVGGFITVRLAGKLLKDIISYLDGLLMGLFSGLIGGTFLDLVTVLQFNSPDNKQMLIRTLEKNWPKDMSTPDFQSMLPSIFLMTCLLIVVITTLFSIIGSYLAIILSKRNKKIEG